MLQYVDDLLLGASSEVECEQNTISLLNFLGECGYKVSLPKAQLVQTSVFYLGFKISQGQRQLTSQCIEAVCRIPPPKTRRQLRGFLRMAGFCHIWIPNFGVLSKPLYEATKGEDRDFFKWTSQCDNAFRQLKQALMSALALGLPNLNRFTFQ